MHGFAWFRMDFINMVVCIVYRWLQKVAKTWKKKSLNSTRPSFLFFFLKLQKLSETKSTKSMY